MAIAAALVLAAPPRPAAGRAQGAFQVVVHRDNPVTSLSRGTAASLFLKKATEWPGGQKVEPVDLREGAPVRDAFSEAVLRRSVASVRAYWTQSIFSGRAVPPPELEDDEAVVAFVARSPWAIGYVSAGARLAGVKAVAVRD
ncbi:type 2 periplasmic-binding domain-containing protein [Anaeromyxobacter paludicola]|uniref:PBP domain-containing protein n=1 Tax=Anaeromyxobacter paludicola TaxID=2918171 RepID=A0ABM7XC97_9BACT|nr:hypothetical protein [Anaeromyxobacter paludicola]BDG09484.1 hypothetical protein AMPC_25970 [Anaeromyxobacter paludicola]